MRSILIFPEIYNLTEIQGVREKYDPLFQNIRPHISLVFPFEAKISDEELIAHVKNALKGSRDFPTTFDRLGSDNSGYLWLEANYGKDNFIKLHDKLYADELFQPFLRTDIPYVPHITLGHVASERQNEIMAQLNLKKLSFSSYIDAVSIEKILPNNDSDEFTQIPLS